MILPGQEDERDKERQKLRDKLDRGEREHEQEVFNRVDEETALAREIDRLRKEGSRQLAEEQEEMKRQMREEAAGRGRERKEAQGGRVKVANISFQMPYFSQFSFLYSFPPHT